MTDVQFMVDQDKIFARKWSPIREQMHCKLERKALYEECRDSGRSLSHFRERIYRG